MPNIYVLLEPKNKKDKWKIVYNEPYKNYYINGGQYYPILLGAIKDKGTDHQKGYLYFFFKLVMSYASTGDFKTQLFISTLLDKIKVGDEAKAKPQEAFKVLCECVYYTATEYKAIISGNILLVNLYPGHSWSVSDYFKKEVIVEEFIGGRELTVGVIGNNGNFRVLPIIEQKFGLLPPGMQKIAGYELKWVYEYKMKSVSDVYDCPAKISKKLENEIQKTAQEMCKVLDVRDCARIDYRLNEKGDLYFLEINTLPGINPDPNETSCYPLAARTAGMDFTQMIGEILRLACERYGL